MVVYGGGHPYLQEVTVMVLVVRLVYTYVDEDMLVVRVTGQTVVVLYTTTVVSDSFGGAIELL